MMHRLGENFILESLKNPIWLPPVAAMAVGGLGNHQSPDAAKKCLHQKNITPISPTILPVKATIPRGPIVQKD
ncbi:hypothetical protein LIER_24091 [Lithospermum erythrorhizon]|uniref:Uncharacterized protein n=1 Tax=Lithospermum erythrorhizon TaxID=34254 RepID=A0AAV3R3J3_LITER